MLIGADATEPLSFACAVTILIFCFFIMPIDAGELVRVAVDVMSHENARITLTESMKGGILAGVGALVGGLALGRAGIAIGGLLGGLFGMTATGDFKPVYEIIRDDLTAAQQAQLATRLTRALQSAGVEDIVRLTALAYSPNIHGLIVAEVLGFMRNEMNLAITQ